MEPVSPGAFEITDVYQYKDMLCAIDRNLNKLAIVLMFKPENQKFFEPRPEVFQIKPHLMASNPIIVFHEFLFFYTEKDLIVIDYR